MNDINKSALKLVMKKINGLGLDKNRLKPTLSAVIKIIEAKENGVKQIQLSAPTGSGKSLIAFILGLHSKIIHGNKSCYLITPRKSLQEQYQIDINKFEFDIPILKGQNSYLCTTDKSRSFATRPCKKFTSIEKIKSGMSCASTCPYLVARQRAIDSSVVVMNNHYLVTALINDHEDFGARKVLIVDEAHNFNTILRDMFSVTVDPMGTSMLLIQSLNMIINNFEEGDSEVADFQNIINRIREAISMIVDINYISQKDDWFAHSEKAFEILESCLRKTKIVIDLIAEYTDKKVDGELEYDDLYFDELREYMTDYSNEFDVLTRVKISVQDDISKFIFEPTENDGVKFSLGDISALYNRYFKDFETVIFMTATPSITHFLELGVEGALKLQMKSNFSKITAPVILLRDKMVDMSYNKRDNNFKKLFVNIMFLVDKHGIHNGLIHTGSYFFQSRFEKYTESIGKSRTFIFCKNTNDIERGMKFLSDNPNSGKVLVSPSILEGVDAKGETAQYQIAMKCPYPNSKDRHIEQIMLKNRVQYNSLVRINIEQMIGRVQRSPFDIGYTYLLDSKFDNFIYRNKLSKHVMDKVIKINSNLIEKVWEKAENVHK